MNHRTALPSHEDLHLAIKQLTETTGKPPTVLALAGHLCLANTTFRRHFPDLTADLTQQRSASPTGPDRRQHTFSATSTRKRAPAQRQP